jgi:hypothetical protein
VTTLSRTLVAALLIGVGAGCTSRADVEQVPIGAAVEVTRADGGVIRGTLTARDDHDLRMAVGPATRSIPIVEIADVEIIEGTAEPALSPAAKFREFTVPRGTVLSARLDSSLASDTSRVEDRVEATLIEAVSVDGVEVLPVGSVITGVVTSADPSGKVKGRANLAMRFRSVAVAGHDETYALSASLGQTAAPTTTSDAKTIGIPAAGGAILGAVLGGKKGAGVGAVIGGGAGAAVVLSTSGSEVRLPSGTVLAIALDDAIDVRVPIER